MNEAAMKNKFIFDVDGTLTPSRGKINEEFSKFFFDFCMHNDVYLVTGSDKPKTVEQIGNDLYGMAKCVYNCSGNDVWQGKTHIHTNEWTIPEVAEYFLNGCLYESRFNLRTGTHIEKRPGMVNFSIVGRGANAEQRQEYVAYDTSTNERDTIAIAFNTMFPDLEAKVGGETGIDISPKGSDKSQILEEFDKNDTLHFFGDGIFPGGNDWSIATAIAEQNRGTFYKVTDWTDTFNKLKELS